MYHKTILLIGVHGFFSNVSLGNMDFNELLYIVKEQIFLNIFFGCEVLNNFQTNESPNILFNPFWSNQHKLISTCLEIFNLQYKLNCISWESLTNYGLVN